MLKEHPGVKLEREAVEQIKNLLGGVPFIRIEGVDREPSAPEGRGQADFLLRFKAHGRS
jgi:hypothetical protein